MIIDENEEAIELEIIDSFELDGKKYAALATPEDIEKEKSQREKTFNGMTARGDNNISFVFLKHSFIFRFNNGSAYSGFLNLIKAQLL